MEPTRASKPIDPSITGHKLAGAISQPAGCTVSTVSNATTAAPSWTHGCTCVHSPVVGTSECTLPHSHAPQVPSLDPSPVEVLGGLEGRPPVLVSLQIPSVSSFTCMPKFLRQSTRFKFNLPITLGSSSLQRPESLSPQSSRYYYLYSHVSPGDCVALSCTRPLHAYNTATIPDPRPCLSTCLPLSRCRSTPGSSTLPDSLQQTHLQ